MRALVNSIHIMHTPWALEPAALQSACITAGQLVIKIFDLVQRSQSGNVMNFGDCCSTEVLKVCRTRFTVCDLQ